MYKVAFTLGLAFILTLSLYSPSNKASRPEARSPEKQPTAALVAGIYSEQISIPDPNRQKMSNNERIRGVQVHRGIIYGSVARLLTPEERALAPPDRTCTLSRASCLFCALSRSYE